MKNILYTIVVVAIFVATTAPVQAFHALGYHWARTANPFTLEFGNNVSANWEDHLTAATADWSTSEALDATVVKGKAKPARRCAPTLGRVEVCSHEYGLNNWLGLAQAWIAPDGEHTTQVTVQLNDTYFNDPVYDTPAWRGSVMCHELGHSIGLDHQDEDFYNTNLGTCLDYSADPAGNEQPNQHDFEELETIYAHLDLFTTVGGKGKKSGLATVDTASKTSWGKKKSSDGYTSVYEKRYADGSKVVTHVVHVK